tara:strand:- start:403 stop:513 length:111 start_codon:yes stop_codon:yes gene_type:complete
MNDFEVKDLYEQVQKMEVRLNALEKCNNECCKTEEE